MILYILNSYRISCLIWIHLNMWTLNATWRVITWLWTGFYVWFTIVTLFFFHLALFLRYLLIILLWAISFRLAYFMRILVLWIFFNPCPRFDMKTILFVLYTILVKTFFRNQILKPRIKMLSIRHHQIKNLMAEISSFNL